MCAVSYVSDYGSQLPALQWEQSNWNEFLKLWDSIKDFDKKTGQPNCEDEKKTEWMKGIEARLRLLEKENSK